MGVWGASRAGTKARLGKGATPPRPCGKYDVVVVRFGELTKDMVNDELVIEKCVPGRPCSSDVVSGCPGPTQGGGKRQHHGLIIGMHL